jgi:hypothetical protein
MRRFAEALLRLTAPAGLLAFWIGMAAAARAYGNYDWRYQTISMLLYSDRNPKGYGWAWTGLELCGLCSIAWAAYAGRRLQRGTAASSPGGLRLLQVGFVCMCCAVLPDRLVGVPRGHEILAIAAFLGVCLGVMQEMFLARDALWANGPRISAVGLPASIQAGVPLVPLVLAGITQAYLTLERPNVPWVSPTWRTLGIPLFLSFAVWEWVSCLLFSACLILVWRSHEGRRVALDP